MKTMAFGTLAVLISAFTAVTAAHAQLRWDEGFEKQSQQHVAGKFDYYALVLSWSPTHCSTEQGADDDLQCKRRDGKRYSFILHGLWPQYTRGWPQDCRTPRRPFVSEPVISSMLDIMPSRQLVIHEYRKHGTCSGLDVPGYFALSRQLFNSIRIPPEYVNPYETQFVAPVDLKRAFVAANPGLPPDAVAVSCSRGSRGRLREVRICFSRDGKKPIACGPNEDQRSLCQAAEMAVPPVRSTKVEDNSRVLPKQLPLPAPR